MTPYILHISILVGCCYIFYKLFLERETFFQLNRWVLLGCVLLAFILPFFEVPQDWSLREKITESPVIKSVEQPVAFVFPKKEQNKNTQRHQIQETASEEKVQKTVSAPTITKEISGKKISFQEVLVYIYFAGLAVFVINFLYLFTDKFRILFIQNFP